MAYTSEESTNLGAYLKAYNDAKSLYDYENNNNQLGHSYSQQGIIVFPYSGQETDKTSFDKWLATSDTATKVAKGKMDSAKTDYDTYLKQINQYSSDRDKADDAARDDAFKAEHPDIYQTLEQANIDANKDITISKQATDAQAALAEKDLYAQSQSKTITYIGIAIGVVVVLVLAYASFFKKTTPGAE